MRRSSSSSWFSSAISLQRQCREAYRSWLTRRAPRSHQMRSRSRNAPCSKRPSPRSRSTTKVYLRRRRRSSIRVHLLRLFMTSSPLIRQADSLQATASGQEAQYLRCLRTLWLRRARRIWTASWRKSARESCSPICRAFMPESIRSRAISRCFAKDI